MLVILQGFPVAAPTEAVLNEKTVAEVGLCDFVRKGFGAVNVFSRR
jgi:hypothetical protein